MADPVLQQWAATDAGVLNRLAGLLCQIAKQVEDENPGTTPRKAYASKVLNDGFGAAAKAAMYLFNTDNFVGQTITIYPSGSGVMTTLSAADADAKSQIFSAWDTLVTLFG